MIVVDTNIIVHLLLGTELTAEAEQLFERDSSWAVPTLWRSEFRSVLARYLRTKRMSFDRAYALQREAEALLAEQEFELDSLDVLSLVNSTRCSAYDCEYVALAQQLRVPLVTLDKQILRAFPGVAVTLAGTRH